MFPAVFQFLELLYRPNSYRGHPYSCWNYCANKEITGTHLTLSHIFDGDIETVMDVLFNDCLEPENSNTSLNIIKPRTEANYGRSYVIDLNDLPFP